MAGVTSQPPSAPAEPVVIRISPMAHLAVGFLALGMLALVLGAGRGPRRCWSFP